MGGSCPSITLIFSLITPNGRLIWEGSTEDEFAMAMPFHVTGVEDAPRRRRKRAA
jgi:hypothetical protein